MKLINAEALFTVVGGNNSPEAKKADFTTMGELVGGALGAAYGMTFASMACKSTLIFFAMGIVFGAMGFKVVPLVEKAINEQRKLARLKAEANIN